MNGTGSPRLTLAELFSPAGIELNLTSTQRNEVLGELVAKIPELASQPEARQTLLKALQDREQLHSTGVGDGIALPHARNVLVGLVKKPVIVFGRHSQGIHYGAIDNQPAKLFFLLVSNSVTQHLQILARISRVLRDPKFRQNLLIADRPEQVISLIREAEANL